VLTADDFDERGDPRLIAVLVAEDAGDEAAVRVAALESEGTPAAPLHRRQPRRRSALSRGIGEWGGQANRGRGGIFAKERHEEACGGACVSDVVL
jgi:hypothetical protein